MAGKPGAPVVLNTLITLVVGVAIASVAAAALPSLLRAAGYETQASLVAAHEPRALPRAVPGAGPHEGLGHARREEGEEGDEADEANDDAEEGPAVAELGERVREAARSLGKLDRGPARGGVAKQRLRLADTPGGRLVVGTVKAGEVVMVAKETGEWALVMHRGEGREGALEVGWVQKSELAIR